MSCFSIVLTLRATAGDAPSGHYAYDAGDITDAEVRAGKRIEPFACGTATEVRRAIQKRLKESATADRPDDAVVSHASSPITVTSPSSKAHQKSGPLPKDHTLH